jgi:hypothetical protein
MSRDPSVIDVQAEIAHWQQRHASEQMGISKFSVLSPVVKLACDIYLQAPRSSQEQRLDMFRDRLQTHFLPPGSQPHLERLATDCWRRLSATP